MISGVELRRLIVRVEGVPFAPSRHRGPGNGDYRGELVRACEAIISYAGWLCMPLSHILVRLDGLYGTAAVLGSPLSSGMGIIVRCKDYGLLDLPAVAARLKQPPDQHTTHSENGARR